MKSNSFWFKQTLSCLRFINRKNFITCFNASVIPYLFAMCYYNFYVFDNVVCAGPVWFEDVPDLIPGWISIKDIKEIFFNLDSIGVSVRLLCHKIIFNASIETLDNIRVVCVCQFNSNNWFVLVILPNKLTLFICRLQ